MPAFPELSNSDPVPAAYHQVLRIRGHLERHSFDREYVKRLTDADPETERHFTKYFGDLLLIKLRSRLRSLQWAEDARQETFLRVFNILRNKGGIEHPERLGAFVNAVCENVLSELFRAANRFQQVPETLTEPSDNAASVESEFITEERQALIRKLLTRLPESDQNLLRKIFLEERDKDEVCRELGIDRDYLRVRIHRALARFRTEFEKAPPRNFSARAAAT